MCRSPRRISFTLQKPGSKGFSGPIGSGKSQALCQEAIRLSYLNPGRTGLVGAPTYPMLRDATLTSFLEVLDSNRIRYELNKSESVLVMQDTGSRIYFRSVDDFERLRGTNLAWFGLDELTYTAEEAWLARDPAARSVHLEQIPEVPASWRDDALAERWKTLRNLRRVVTGALEVERAAKRIGSALEAAPIIYIRDAELFAVAVNADLAELCITSQATLVEGEGPPSAFRLDDVPSVAVEPRRAEGRKCARSWKITPAVGEDPQFPDVTPRDAQALREWEATRNAAE